MEPAGNRSCVARARRLRTIARVHLGEQSRSAITKAPAVVSWTIGEWMRHRNGGGAGESVPQRPHMQAFSRSE